MIQSRPVDVDGRFVGIAVHAAADWHFVAVDPALGDLHGERFPNPEEATRVARLVLRRDAPPADAYTAYMPWVLAG